MIIINVINNIIILFLISATNNNKINNIIIMIFNVNVNCIVIKDFKKINIIKYHFLLFKKISIKALYNYEFIYGVFNLFRNSF